jgi:alpha-1,3-mannosyltransferase
MQVFSCWNGAVAFTAKPILEGEIAFRSARRGECHAGEPTLFSIDMWNNGFGKIGIVPSVNLGYEDNDDVQKLRGSVSSWIQKGDLGVEKIRWESEGPNKIKCWEGGVWEKPSWAPWAVEQNLSSVVDRMLRS